MKIAVAVVAVLALALGAAGVVFGVGQAGKVSALTRQLHQEQAAIRSLSARESSLGNEVATLNVPSDPLSAYNAVCSQDMTNQSSGITQTYWFPCTNSAQTIPQPGN